MDKLVIESEENLKMTDKRQPHEQMTEKNNGLSSAQEVLYDKEFQKADNAEKKDNQQQNLKKKN